MTSSRSVRGILLPGLAALVTCSLGAGIAEASNYTGDSRGTESAGVEPLTTSVNLFAGSATSGYSFAVPPGLGGLQPSLELSYNSGSMRQSMLGRGWNLPLPRIQRNLRFGPASFTWGTTEFALVWNGSPLDLRMIADYTSGGIGVREFRTEIQTFLRVKSYTDPTAFTYWEIEDGEGRKYQLGNPGHDGTASQTGDSSWALNRIQDAHGNYLTLSWLLDQGVLYPREIRYTGNVDGTPPANRVEFGYEGRQDVVEDIVGAKRSLPVAKMRYRIRRIKTWAGITPVSNYLFLYTTPGTGEHPIDLCAGATCGASSLACGNGTTATCQNSCDPQSGLCIDCSPNCCGQGCGVSTATCSNGTTANCSNSCQSDFGCQPCTPYCPPPGGGGGGCPHPPCKPIQLDNPPDSADPLNPDSPQSLLGAPPVAPTLLFAIQRFNSDGRKNLPATTFAYTEDTAGHIGWPDAGPALPVSFLWKQSTANGRDVDDYGVQLVDVNGDALPDIVQAYDPYDSNPNDSIRRVFLNVGGQWQTTPSTEWIPPTDAVVHDSGFEEYDNGVRYVDIDGDGLVDVVRSILLDNGPPLPVTEVWLNNGHGWGTKEAVGAWSIPIEFVRTNDLESAGGIISLDNGVRFADVNGDGRTDLVYGVDDDSGHHGHVYLNNGSSGWTDANSSTWVVPQAFMHQFDGRSTADIGTRLIDVNGDGLADLVRSNNFDWITTSVVLINRGRPDSSGNLWVADSEYQLPELFTHTTEDNNDSDDLGVRFGDVNGDGRVDLLVARYWEDSTPACGDGGWSTCQAVYLQSADKKWIQDTAWSAVIPSSFFFIEHRASAEDYDDGVRVADVDGNGTVDLVKAMDNYRGENSSHLNRDGFSDLLRQVTNSAGGISTFAYGSSASYPNGDPGAPVGTTLGTLPFVVPLVQASTTGDGGTGPAHVYTTTYSYAGGYFHHDRREFRGFGYVRRTLPGGSLYSEQVVVQDRNLDFAPLLGSVEREAIRRTSDGHVYSARVMSYDRSDTLSPYLHWLASEDQYLFDWSTSAPIESLPLGTALRHVSTGHAYQFAAGLDGFIVKHETRALGDTAIPGDDVFQTVEFINDVANWRLRIPTHQVATTAPDMLGDRLAENWSYFDNLPFGQVGPVGDLTRSEAWSGSAGDSRGAMGNRNQSATYDTYGHMSQQVDGEGHLTTIQYGATNETKGFPRAIQVQTSQGGTTTQHEITYVFDPKFGLPTEVTRTGQATLRSAYDDFGRLEQTWTPTDPPTRPNTCTQYLSYLRPMAVLRFQREQTGVGETCGTSGMLTTAEFIDGLGRVIQRKSEGAESGFPSVVSDATVFDSAGRPAKVYRPYFETHVPDSYFEPASTLPAVSYQYDDLGRPTLTTPPGIAPIHRTYNASTVSRRDSQNLLVQSDLDAFGRVSEYRTYTETDALYSTTHLDYDRLGRLARITDSLGNHWTYEYNPFGDRLTSHDPDAGNTSSQFSRDGTLSQATDALNRTTTYEYDALRRLRFVHRPDGSQIENRYDETTGGAGAKGRLTSSVDTATGVVEEFEYDSLGRLTTEKTTLSGVPPYYVRRQYDAMSRVTSLIYPDNVTIGYTYRSDGKLGGIPGFASTLHYTAAGDLTSYLLNNGIAVTNAFDATTGRLNAHTAVRSNGYPVQNLSYSYYPTGYVQSITDLVGTASQTFELDHQYRLKRAQGSYGDLHYDYDVLGNMTMKEGVTSTLDPGAPHRVASDSAGHAFTYLPDGALTTDASSTVQWTYGYDLDGRLSQASEGLSGRTAAFTYGPGGTRVKRVESGGGQPTVTTIQIQDLHQVVDGVAKDFIYLGGKRIAEVRNSVDVTFFLDDLAGSTSVATDGQTGAPLGRTEYKPYGEIAALQGAGASLDFGFAGVRREVGLGLSDFGARFYSPTLGRFLSTDPLLQLNGHPVSLNPYAYGRHNPTSFTDIGGLFYEVAWFDDEEGLGGANSSDCAKHGTCFADFDSNADASTNYQLPDGVQAAGSGWDESPSRGPLGYQENVIVTAPYPSSGLSFGQQVALNIAVTVAISFLPGGPEYLDLATAFAEDSTPLERGLAGVSLAANFFLPILPNFSTISRLVHEGDALADAAREGKTTLYRAVKQAELEDLAARSGTFRNPMGVENKYFSTTAEGAASYAQQAYRQGGMVYEGPYTIVRTEIPNSAVRPGMIIPGGVDGGIPTMVVPSAALPLLSPAVPLVYSPVPW